MTSQPSLMMFGVFVGITLIVTYWASGQSTTSRGFYTAHRRIGGVQNGWAIAGDYMSAASFLGITGLGRVLRLRRLHVFRWMVGRVPRRALSGGRAAAQHRQIHDGRPHLVSPARARRARYRSRLDAGNNAVLHDRANGRQRLDRQPAAAAVPGVRRHRRRRRAHARIRALRRNVGDHVGANHQGRAADGDRASRSRCWSWRHFGFSLGQFLDAATKVPISGTPTNLFSPGCSITGPRGLEPRFRSAWRWCSARPASRTS